MFDQSKMKEAERDIRIALRSRDAITAILSFYETRQEAEKQAYVAALSLRVTACQRTKCVAPDPSLLGDTKHPARLSPQRGKSNDQSETNIDPARCLGGADQGNGSDHFETNRSLLTSQRLAPLSEPQRPEVPIGKDRGEIARKCLKDGELS
jgi:hypothetical protein